MKWVRNTSCLLCGCHLFLQIGQTPGCPGPVVALRGRAPPLALVASRAVDFALLSPLHSNNRRACSLFQLLRKIWKCEKQSLSSLPGFKSSTRGKYMYMYANIYNKLENKIKAIAGNWRTRKYKRTRDEERRWRQSERNETHGGRKSQGRHRE